MWLITPKLFIEDMSVGSDYTFRDVCVLFDLIIHLDRALIVNAEYLVALGIGVLSYSYEIEHSLAGSGTHRILLYLWNSGGL